MSRVNNYMFVCYDYDANEILVEAIKNREMDSIIASWNKLHKGLTKNGHNIIKYILDNKYSAQFKITLKETEMDFEVVPPHQY